MAGKPETRIALAKVEKAGGADAIIRRVADGETLKDIAADIGTSRQVLSTWLNADAQRRDALTRARREAAAALAEEALGIADQASPETERVDRLRIDTRKWVAGRLDPESWGDRAGVQVQVSIGELHLRAVKALRQGDADVVDVQATEQRNDTD